MSQFTLNMPMTLIINHELDIQYKSENEIFLSIQGSLIQSSDLRSGSAKSRSSSTGRKDLHGYDGPMQYINKADHDNAIIVS